MSEQIDYYIYWESHYALRISKFVDGEVSATYHMGAKVQGPVGNLFITFTHCNCPAQMRKRRYFCKHMRIVEDWFNRPEHDHIYYDFTHNEWKKVEV